LTARSLPLPPENRRPGRLRKYPPGAGDLPTARYDAKRIHFFKQLIHATEGFNPAPLIPAHAGI
jgi:hypothetical protein